MCTTLFHTIIRQSGFNRKVSDYQRAFTEDIELPQVISKIGGVLTSMGYGLKDAEMEIKSIKVKQAEDNAMSSKNIVGINC